MTRMAGDIPDQASDLRQASDQQLAAALRDAELPSLMPALAYLTGDMSLVGSELRVHYAADYLFYSARR